MQKLTLPIDAHLESITEAVRNHPNLIIRASPGSGKTTRVPPSLLRSVCPPGKAIYVLEPRRLAAKLSALRVAQELGEEIGQTVGYAFRNERVSSKKTQILFLTEGTFNRILLNAPQLPEVYGVILDEFHERNLQTDIALAYLTQLQKSSRRDLRIIPMSATLQTTSLQSHLENSQVVDIEAPRFPVETHYLPRPPQGPLEKLVKNAVAQCLKATQGGVLVFLPGWGEIERCREELRDLPIDVHRLHSQVSKEEQNRAVEPSQAQRVILSTNIAESSLTIPGITAVIDSGLFRRSGFSPSTAMETLTTEEISKASATQRTGRAGRTGPGICIRLFTETNFIQRPDEEMPEIQRCDLSGVLLEMASLGILEPNWLDPPLESNERTAWSLLERLEAIYPDRTLTPTGKDMVGFPLSPRWSRILVEGEKWGVGSELCALISELTEGRSQNLDAREKGPYNKSREALERKLRQLLKSPSPGMSNPDSLARSLLKGFPDRVAQKRTSKNQPGQEVELLFCEGGVAKVSNHGVVAESDYFIVLDLSEIRRGTQRENRIRKLFPISEDLLMEVLGDQVQETQKLEWDRARKRVTKTSRLSYGLLHFIESRENPSPNDATLPVLLMEGLGLTEEKCSRFSPHEWIEALNPVLPSDSLETLFAKYEMAATQMPEWRLPPLSQVNFMEHLTTAGAGAVSLGDLKEKDIPQQLGPILFGENWKDVHRLFPEFCSIPGRKRVEIQYAMGKNPWIESRLQDFFGLSSTPRILFDRLPLTLHLLAPNRRAVQVTQDISSFWKNAYPEIRKSLMRRYPRHSWPEDPISQIDLKRK